MNERIKELAKQAECRIDGMGYGEGNIEKFVELIIAECLNICSDNAVGEREYNQARLDCKQEIKERFGVK